MNCHFVLSLDVNSYAKVFTVIPLIGTEQGEITQKSINLLALF